MISKFTDIGIPDDVAKAMDDMGWEEPTPIQVQSVPLGLKGIDMFAQAQTGTGKTGAYGSIILGRIPSKQKVPTAIVLVPTRELANQVSDELEKLSKYSGHVCLPIYGGASIEGQIKKLQKGCDIVAGTPGRVRDMIARGVLNLSEIQMMVLDEADRMLDMGFVDDIEAILKAMPAERHTLLFSATMQENVKQLAFDYMKNPKEVSVSQDEVVLDLTKQYYISVGRRNKSWALCRILDIDEPKAIIFCQTKKMVDVLDERLTKLEYKVEAIHGDMPQTKREKVIKDFKEDVTDILIATDVAARGLDIDDINYVINYDMPDDIDTYIHRIGRTGRAGREGTAVSFVTSEEEHLVREFEMRTGMDIEKRDVPDAEPGQRDTIKKVVDYDQISDVFGMCKFEINLGKNDGFKKVSLADFIIRNARIREVSIGKIEIGPDSSIVEVHKDFGNRMTMDLTKAKFKSKRIMVRVIQD
ncbi:MAG: DEAD/DEAH box helicase [Candidatus Methanomethylophilaceae archaeon]|nr:DEAD/DEAH box helicase [Candidatus Methanomethylophilaceae archaeon]MBR2347936.1 DEAD/DEAH box helicase [Candidatus Methanomethylophilaceae archaeon]